MGNKELEYRKWVQEKLSNKRWAHVLLVVKEAEFLANQNGADIEKCRMAALLHDAAKELPLERMQELCRKGNFSDLSEEDYQKGEILHGFAARILIQQELGMEDREILEAVQYHTIGRKQMSLVAEIVYIADAIEESRQYPAVKEIREKTHKNLQDGILVELQHKCKYLASIGASLHPNTLEWKRSLEEGRQ